MYLNAQLHIEDTMAKIMTIALVMASNFVAYGRAGCTAAYS